VPSAKRNLTNQLFSLYNTMNEYPSSAFLRSVYNGLKLYVFTPIIFLLLVLIFDSAGSKSTEVLYLLPMLTIIATGYILYVTSKFNENVTEEIDVFVRRLKVGAAFWIISAVLQLLMMLAEIRSEHTILIFVLSMFVLQLAGYGTVGSGYGGLSSESGMRGANLASKGCYAVVFATITMVLLFWIRNSMDMPKGMGWYGPSAAEIQSYQTKMAWIMVFLVLSLLTILGGLCAIIFGHRFLIDSAEIYETDETSSEDIPSNYCYNPEMNKSPLSTSPSQSPDASTPQHPTLPDSDATRLIDPDSK